jgi:hypothetical protein
MEIWISFFLDLTHRFFYNTGGNDFTDNTTVIYPDYDGTWNWPSRGWDPSNYVVERNRNSRGSQWVDFDNDGDLDLYIANYFLQKDEFYENDGNGGFTDICSLKGIDRNNTGSNHGTGVDWYDYNNDGNIDLLLPQFAHPRYIADYDHRGTAIYKNNGAPDYTFTDVVGQYNNFVGLKSDIGLELEETHAGGAWGDVNNDGLADFLMTVFYGCRYIDLYIQQENNRFALETYKYGLSGINTGTDLVWLDYDNDGRLDLAGAISGKFRLFKNSKYNSRRWIELDLSSASTNTYAIGARASVYVNGKCYMQEVCAGRGQKMQKPYRLHFGLNFQAVVDSVVVRWPGSPSDLDSYYNLETNTIYNLKEGGDITLSYKDKKDPIESLEVFPNPAEDFLMIKGNSIQSIRICNTLGEVVWEKKVSTDQLSINTSSFPAGFYIVKINCGGVDDCRLIQIL